MRARSTAMLLLLLTGLATPVSADPPRGVPSAAGDAATGAEEEQRRRATELALAIAARLEEQERLDRQPDAAAEALFVAAERKREAAERVALEEYRGPGDRTSVREYLVRKAEPWLSQKLAAIKVAERAHARVFGVELPPPPPPPPPPRTGEIGLLGGDPSAPLYPAEADPLSTSWAGEPPSPRWAIASAARVGAMWAELHGALRSLPVPSSWGAGDPGASYYHTPLDSPGDEARWRAKEAFAVCVRLGIRYRILDEHTRACEAWLTRHVHHEYMGLPELHAPPSFRSVGIVARPAPLRATVAAR